eukprot:scaffold4846_cov222-Prasinococcus_capsulatus_cf.AAC.1
MLLGSARQQEYWAWSRDYAARLLNFRIHSALQGRSPIDIFYRRSLRNQPVQTKPWHFTPFGFPV